MPFYFRLPIRVFFVYFKHELSRAGEVFVFSLRFFLLINLVHSFFLSIFVPKLWRD